jgi:phosphoribosylformimino-5-aminoimidazole carboxamide ribotide isomerase
MRIIPVLDILGGKAVHARGGHRDSYAPLSSQLAPSAPGDALAIVRAVRDRLGVRELYLADLDAIMGGVLQRVLGAAIARERPDVAVWIDAGVSTPERARDVVAAGAARVIVGLETLQPAPDPHAALEQLVETIEGAGTEVGVGVGVGVAFSLDLRAGRPRAADPALRALHPVAIAELAAGCGIGTIIVLDLDRVGSATGPELSLVRAIRRALPDTNLVVGGGVRDAADLELLADEGADAALVGSALHHGSLAQGSILWTCGEFASDVTSPLADD